MKLALFSIIGLCTIYTAAHAGDVVTSDGKDSKTTVVESTPFDKGKMEFQLSAGALTSLFNFGEHRPKITDIDVSLRLGWMLYTPSGSGCLRGNFEFMIEADGAYDVAGPKTGMVGGNLILRYNFVQPDAKLVPYFQVQGGGVFTDIDHDTEQDLIGRDEEFFLGAGLGARYFLSPRIALTLEADFRHNSDADTADRNIGLNSVGGLFGLSVFF
jgi:lipid A 3-O-deacylase